MQMEAGLDTGPMIAKAATPVAAKTAGALTGELAEMGAKLLVEVLAGDWTGNPQPADGVTLAPKIAKAEAALDFTRPAAELERAVRAFNPAPGAFCSIAGERLKILAAEVVAGVFEPGVIGDGLVIGTGDGALRPTQVQRAGKPAMAVAALLNGWAVPAGTRVDA
jgi:methionyl-tRNA formyltransferase